MKAEKNQQKGLTIDCAPSGRNGTATLTVKLADNVLAVENLNLTKPRARADFLARLCEGRSGINKAAIKAELLQLAADLVAKPKGKTTLDADNVLDTKALLAEMPKSIQVEARGMLKAPDLLGRVIDDIEVMGVAGERKLAATLYLVGTSRLLTKPLAAIVQGPSSSGKSHTIEKTAALFPPESTVLATRMTPQALVHMKPGSLVHRFIVAGERSKLENDESAESTRLLREMLSAGKLSKLMPVKIGNEIETRLIEQEGPIAFVESTTLSKIMVEDANRCLLLVTDEQPEQTRRIITRLAEDYGGKTPEDRVEQVILRHYALQRMLKPYSVIIPFAKRLGGAIDHNRVQARRAFRQLMSMIQASALLYQRQRKIDGNGRILANADDYECARWALAVPMARQLSDRVADPAKRFLERLKRWFGPKEIFTAADAKRKESRSKSAVYGWLAELHDAGILEQVEDQRGNRAAQWRLSPNAPDLDAVAVLPTVKELFS
jgi:hypothetical protein